MVMTAYVAVDMRGGRSVRRGEAVLIRAETEPAVAWVKRCRGGGKNQVRVGALVRMMGALKAKGGGCFRARHIQRGINNRLADGLTRWVEEQISEKLNAERPEVAWQAQELGDRDQLMCTEILRESMYLEEKRRRLEVHRRRMGECG